MPFAASRNSASPADQGVSTDATSRSQSRRPERRSSATVRPPSPVAKTRPRSITGMAAMAAMSARPPPRAEARVSLQAARPSAARIAASSPEPKPATTSSPSTAGAGRPRLMVVVGCAR